ncbi:MAG: hypothetical protein VBE63_24400 [Lamprobacter sp.]|uniref:hypothetical protein n=1 Tax=Lamprobacter sp. TaxID=3100796 RepID=UPI002B25DCC2|nr:hypothetical protein [Lamprobacter sp.]MEA3643057.1 hypothetical protein [Lamprobacter sp.]
MSVGTTPACISKPTLVIALRPAANGWTRRFLAGRLAGDCRPRLIWGGLAHRVGSWIGKAEQRFASMTGNPRASFVGSRRVETAPWFALVGVIANGRVQTQQDGSPVPHETLVIGAGLDAWTPKQGSGYLYCFANDAWRFYGNNRGHVRLTITRTG